MAEFDFGTWLSQNSPSPVASSAPLRAQVQQARILDKYEDIQFLRDGEDVPLQRVRIEWTEGISDADSDLGVATVRRGYIMGFKDHPTLPDLDVREWDTFRLYKQEYTVKSVNYHLIGQIQAVFEAV